ncbi:glycoside hydrolase family 43 protein [Paenibacillus sp. FSL H8-0259]|uniref:glycoside hydrolase family 43 protein n=1 Tax=Paenibacillus sp. FSL H8-0259 TaxID=1920423 RepID=UPI00097013A9|nr:glycoside hydrolase family 43 protein [Paenibacillus sp. FSL H8-0259]OMF33061.1 glycoside hydrolase 43 family protein [Paenibacillus sp. FSL H8-0259]
MQYTNPVIPGFHPDPSICRAGDDYYLVTSTFEYYPGVPIFHSRDLVHWRQIGHCLTTAGQLPLENAGSSGGIFAPTLRYHNGWFYMVTTNVSGMGNFFVKTQNPEGPWSQPYPVAQSGIDPSLLFDEDGRVYFQSARDGEQGNGIYQCEIDIETGCMLTESMLIWKGTGGAHPEAPHVYRNNGWYYLMIAEGGTEYGHMETIARSRQPYGPYEACPHNPILSNRSMHSSIHATGHADLIEAQDGSWWAVCLGIRPVSYPMGHHLGRETFLAPVTWTAEGWPVIGNGGHIEPVMDSPLLPEVRWPEKPVRDHFDGTGLGLDWTFLRNPAEGSWSLEERPGHLVLHGHEATLNEAAAPAFVGRRLSHFTANIAAALDYEPQHEGEEAGLTVYKNERHHYELVLRTANGRRVAVFRRTVGSLRVEHVEECPAGPVILRIKALPGSIEASVQSPESGVTELGSGETHHLSTEISGGFTGVFVAMYATSGSGLATPAAYDWFDYEPLDQPAV